MTVTEANAAVANGELTLDAIEALLADSRTRGEYRSVIEDWFATGELTLNLSNKFPGKAATAIKQSAVTNAEKIVADSPAGTVPAYRVIVAGKGDGAQCLMFNMTAYAAAKQQAEEDGDTDANTED